MNRVITRLVIFFVLLIQGLAMPQMKWDSLMLMKAAAERGDREAQFLYGVQIMVGDGAPQDRVEAVKWLRKAAESGHAEAQYELGMLYADSDPEHGVSDPDEAAKWLQAAAEQGNTNASARLGPLLAKGLEKHRYRFGVNSGHPDAVVAKPGDPAADAPALLTDQSRKMDEDPAETIRWSLLLSGLRGADAFLVRGFLLENSIVVNRDLAAAADYYRKAAEQGDARAQFRLGLMYAEGRGMARDMAESRMWLSRAATAGSTEAADLLAKLKETQAREETTESATKLGQKHSGEPGKK